MTTPRIPNSRRVLVDTGAFYALADAGDRNHHRAIAGRNRIVQEQRYLFTTNFAVAETHALLLNRLGHAPATVFLTEITRSATTVVRVSAADEARARHIILQYDDKDFSLTDALSFAVMERLRIPEAFSFDRNFVQYGVPLLNADEG